MLYEILSDEVAELKKDQIAFNKARIQAYGCNLLTKLFDKLEKKNKSALESSSSSSNYTTSTKYTRMAERLDKTKFLKETKLPSKSYDVARLYPKVSISN